MIVTYHVIQDSNYLTFDMVANMLHHVQRVFHYDADTISSPSNMDGQMGCKSYYKKMGWVMEIDADLIIGPETMKNQTVIENTSRQKDIPNISWKSDQINHFAGHKTTQSCR